MKTAALIVAAGRGRRADNGIGVPKQFLPLGSSNVLAEAITPFIAHPKIHMVQVVVAPEDGKLYEIAVTDLAGDLLPPVFGGETRQSSVLYGLAALADHNPEYVLVHDAARPFVAAAGIDRVLEGLKKSDAVIAALPSVDTMKRTDETAQVRETLDRNGLWHAQTPQGFRFGPILKSHQDAASTGAGPFQDDAAIAEWSGMPVRVVEGSKEAFKITTPEDVELAVEMFQARRGHRVVGETVVGTGFDVHRFCDGDHVWLGGLKIPHEHGLEGHSDADVALHAVTDALLGAIGEGDIGALFPPTDPKWKDTPSKVFVEDAARRVRARGGVIANVDLTIICEQPKIGSHRAKIQAHLASLLGIPVARANVKGTTTEGLGFTGRKEGIAALASVSVRLPDK